MFPEMAEEFSDPKFQYPSSQLFQLQEDLDDPDLPEYELELERPYGSYKIMGFYREKEP